MPTTKLCIKCQSDQPLDAFYRQPQSRDGFGSVCRRCTAQASLARYHAIVDVRARTGRRERVARTLLDDPATLAAREAAAQAAYDEFGALAQAAFDAMQRFLDGRTLHDLHPHEIIVYMAKRAYCNALTTAQQRFANAELARLLDLP
jgi:ribosomal protein L40E